MTENRFSVGNGWGYQCKHCNYQVGIYKAFPETCPGCGATGWWGRLTTDVIDKPGQKNGDGDSIKNCEETMPGGIKTRNRILSQLPDAVVYQQRQNKGIYATSPGRRRGRPRQQVPEGLDQLSKQGLSSRQIAADLAGRGFHLSYKTIQRHLKVQSQGVLI